MTIDTTALRELLCARLCEEVGVSERPDGELMLRTHFTFPDGDGYPFHLAEAPAGGLRLSDFGHTLMHISYEHDIDTFLTGTRGMLLERIVRESGILYDEGVFSLETSAERLPEAIFGFGQACSGVTHAGNSSSQRFARRFQNRHASSRDPPSPTTTNLLARDREESLWSGGKDWLPGDIPVWFKVMAEWIAPP